MFHSARKMFFILFTFVFLLMSGGVYAMWEYAKEPANIFSGNQSVGLQTFEYAPDEVLPDTPEDSVNQTNHMDIIYELLFNSKMGMNSGKGDKMEAEIAEYGLLHYLENVQGGNLKHLIDVSEGGKNLGFSLEYINDEQFYAYTYYRLNYTDGQEIIVYRTLMEINTDPNYDYNGDGRKDAWKAKTSLKGVAKVIYYSNNQYKVVADTWREV